MTNADFAATNQEFITACVASGAKQTKRQASKWRNKKGKAWKGK